MLAPSSHVYVDTVSKRRHLLVCDVEHSNGERLLYTQIHSFLECTFESDATHCGIDSFLESKQSTNVNICLLSRAKRNDNDEQEISMLLSFGSDNIV